MTAFKYTAHELFDWLTQNQDIFVLDVRNDKDFNRFQVESPFPMDMANISYYDFMEIEAECVAKVPSKRPIRIVCAKEGSAKYVADILIKNGFGDVGYLQDGIKSWGNLLYPMLINPGEKYQLFQFIRPGKASCSYGLLYDNEIIFFDPSRNTSFYQDFAATHKCTITKTFETHLQADYIAGSRLLMEAANAECMVNGNDFEGAQFDFTKIDDGKSYKMGSNGPAITAMFTPGHTPGSTSFLIDDRYFISGDTLFLQSVGRPDLGGQVDKWAGMLLSSLKKVQTLNHNLILLPGHYIDWREANAQLIFALPLGEAIKHNKTILDLDSEDEFLAFIKKNMRDQPAEYATIRKINANLQQVDNEKAEELDLGKNECAASADANRNQSGGDQQSGDS